MKTLNRILTGLFVIFLVALFVSLHRPEPPSEDSGRQYLLLKLTEEYEKAVDRGQEEKASALLNRIQREAESVPESEIPYPVKVHLK